MTASANDFAQDPEAGGDARPSKSARKREMHARQDLGSQLVALSNAQLAKLGLSDNLLAAIHMAQRVTAHEARRRQMQYIGKLMRDADYESIRAAFDDLTGSSRESVALMHRCERLRDQLIDDDAMVARFIEDNPGVDTQWLRTKVRATRQERTAARPPRHARELYKWLYAHYRGEAGSATADAPDGDEAEDGQDEA